MCCVSGSRPSIIHMGQAYRNGSNGLNNGLSHYNLHNGTLPARIGTWNRHREILLFFPINEELSALTAKDVTW